MGSHSVTFHLTQVGVMAGAFVFALLGQMGLGYTPLLSCLVSG